MVMTRGGRRTKAALERQLYELRKVGAQMAGMCYHLGAPNSPLRQLHIKEISLVCDKLWELYQQWDVAVRKAPSSPASKIVRENITLLKALTTISRMPLPQLEMGASGWKSTAQLYFSILQSMSRAAYTALEAVEVVQEGRLKRERNKLAGSVHATACGSGSMEETGSTP